MELFINLTPPRLGLQASLFRTTERVIQWTTMYYLTLKQKKFVMRI